MTIVAVQVRSASHFIEVMLFAVPTSSNPDAVMADAIPCQYGIHRTVLWMADRHNSIYYSTRLLVSQQRYNNYMSLHYELDDYDLDGFISVASTFGADRFGYVVTPNVDHLIRYHDDPKFQEQYANASYVLLDSRFLSHIFRAAKGMRVRVCTGSDLTARLFSQVIAPDDSIVLIGGGEEQARLLARTYGLKSLHHYNPPMGFIRDPLEVDTCLNFVEAHSPFRFCFIAVGAPQQEILAQLLKKRRLARGLALCIGASINFMTGKERRAPQWMQRVGLEWMYRLAIDPRRLARRYLVRGPRVFSLLRQTEVVVRAANGLGTTTIAATTIPIQQYDLALVRGAIPEAAPAIADRLPLNIADGG
jgi:exopolysaccharide biosynthesis WecB/TagA/CpsF family protein